VIDRDQSAVLFLRTVLRQPGCLVCRLGGEAATRYLQQLLWENVNDLQTRIRISESQGFCPSHAWELFCLESRGSAPHLGNSILYEDLASQILRVLQAMGAPAPPETPLGSGSGSGSCCAAGRAGLRVDRGPIWPLANGAGRVNRVARWSGCVRSIWSTCSLTPSIRRCMRRRTGSACLTCD
jgi:hypothetical protein